MSHPESGRRAPLLAVLFAGAGLASMLFVPTLLPTVAVAAVALLGSAAAVRRRSRGLAVAIAAVSFLLAIGLGGAWLLRTSATGGLAWTLLVVFVVPLPLVPWLYAVSFDDEVRAGTSPAPQSLEGGVRGQGSGDSTDPCSLSPVPRVGDGR